MPSLVTKYCALNAVTQFVTKWPVLGELEEALKLSDYLLVRCMADNNDVVAKCLGDVCSFETNFTLNLARAQVLAAMAVRDKDAAKLTAAEQEIEKIRSQMLGWDCDAYTEAVIAKALQVIFKATGREAEDRTRLEEAVSKLEIRRRAASKSDSWEIGSFNSSEISLARADHYIPEFIRPCSLTNATRKY